MRSQHSPGKEEGRDDSNDKYSEYDLKYEHYYNNLQVPNYKNISSNVKAAMDFTDVEKPFSRDGLHEPLFPVISGLGLKLDRRAYTVKKTPSKKIQDVIMKQGKQS